MAKIDYGFTNDSVFGWVMDNKEFCKYLLQIIIPNLQIQSIQYLNRQHDISTPDKSRDIRLYILVTDTSNRLYDIEMQVANHKDIGERTRFYQSKIDSYALQKGKTFHNLKESYVIFLCSFDPFGFDKLRYSFSMYEDNLLGACKLNDKTQRIIINSKGKRLNVSKELQALADLMNNQPRDINHHFAYAINEIKRINADPEKRRSIMTLEEKLNEMKYEGRIEGKIEATIETYHQLGQSQEAALNAILALNLISPQKAKKLVAEIYTKN